MLLSHSVHVHLSLGSRDAFDGSPEPLFHLGRDGAANGGRTPSADENGSRIVERGRLKDLFNRIAMADERGHLVQRCQSHEAQPLL